MGWDQGLKPEEGRPEGSLAECQVSQQFQHPWAFEPVDPGGAPSSCLGPGMQSSVGTIPQGNPAGLLSGSKFPATHSRF